jgi:Spy/CpxP family protein refolding chaperone
MRSSAVRRTLAGWAAVAFLLAVPLVAAAQPSGMPGQAGPGQMPPGGRGMMPPPGMGPGGGPPWVGAVMRLDLTEQQRADIKTLIDGQRESERSVREQTRATQQQLAAAVFTASPDAAAISEIVQHLAELQKQGLETDVALQQRVSALLNDTQRAQLVKLLSQGPPRGGPPPEH